MIGSSMPAPGGESVPVHFHVSSAGNRRPGAVAAATAMAWPHGALDMVLLDAGVGGATRASTKMVDVARSRDATIWDQAGAEPRRGGDPVDFVYDAAPARAAATVARLRPTRVGGGDTIDTIFGAGDRSDA